MSDKTRPTMMLRFTHYMIKERVMQLGLDDQILISLLEEIEDEFDQLDNQIYEAYGIDKEISWLEKLRDRHETDTSSD